MEVSRRKEIGRNIAIVWDFDGTLASGDSTSAVVNILGRDDHAFWDAIHRINGKAGNSGED